MDNNQSLSSENGKICYVEIPAVDIAKSSKFYEEVFGWHIRKDNSGHVAFDDGVGQVSGMWVLDRPLAKEPGLIVSIMVDNASKAIDAITAHGGEIVRPLDSGEYGSTAWFRDPAGNVFGIYKEPTTNISSQ